MADDEKNHGDSTGKIKDDKQQSLEDYVTEHYKQQKVHNDENKFGKMKGFS